MAGDVPVVVVGGGAHLCGERLAGASHVLRPAYATVANAVGAAIPQACPRLLACGMTAIQWPSDEASCCSP